MAAAEDGRLSTYRFDKLFTPGEANQLIPQFTSLIGQLQASAATLRQRIAELVELDPRVKELGLPEIIQRCPDLRGPAMRMAEIAQKIESHGCFLKDIDQGLVDFPWEIEEDNVVFLCWQVGEPAVLAWHPLEGGVAQRQPLRGVPKPYLN
jgi:hypothetical protein